MSSKSTCLFTPQGGTPFRTVRVSGRVHRTFDNELKGFCCVSGNSSSGLTLPKGPKNLRISHPIICLQVKLSREDLFFKVELGATDGAGRRKRIVLSTSFKEILFDPLHSQIPLRLFSPHVFGEIEDRWTILSIDVSSFLKSNSFRITSISVLGVFRLRQIFSLPEIIIEEKERVYPMDQEEIFHWPEQSIKLARERCFTGTLYRSYIPEFILLCYASVEASLREAFVAHHGETSLYSARKDTDSATTVAFGRTTKKQRAQSEDYENQKNHTVSKNIYQSNESVEEPLKDIKHQEGSVTDKETLDNIPVPIEEEKRERTSAKKEKEKCSSPHIYMGHKSEKPYEKKVDEMEHVLSLLKTARLNKSVPENSVEEKKMQMIPYNEEEESVGDELVYEPLIITAGCGSGLKQVINAGDVQDSLVSKSSTVSEPFSNISSEIDENSYNSLNCGKPFCTTKLSTVCKNDGTFLTEKPSSVAAKNDSLNASFTTAEDSHVFLSRTDSLSEVSVDSVENVNDDSLEEDQEEGSEVDLEYDPVQGRYFCPKTKKYYDITDDEFEEVDQDN